MKKNILKTICLLLVLMLCVGVFCACDKEDKSEIAKKKQSGLGNFEGLDERIELSILKEYYGTSFDEIESVNNNPIIGFYGTFGNRIVVEIARWGASCMDPFEYVVDDVLFVHPSQMFVFENEELTALRSTDHTQFNKEEIELLGAKVREKYQSYYAAQARGMKEGKTSALSFLNELAGSEEQYSADDWHRIQLSIGNAQTEFAAARTTIEIMEIRDRAQSEIALVINDNQ